MVRVFPKSANQPNEIALTICNPISRYCFVLIRDWKLENLPNGKEISVVPFRMGKEEYHWRCSTIFERNFWKITSPFGFEPKFPDLFGQIVSTPSDRNRGHFHVLCGKPRFRVGRVWKQLKVVRILMIKADFFSEYLSPFLELWNALAFRMWKHFENTVWKCREKICS